MSANFLLRKSNFLENTSHLRIAHFLGNHIWDKCLCLYILDILWFRTIHMFHIRSKSNLLPSYILNTFQYQHIMNILQFCIFCIIYWWGNSFVINHTVHMSKHLYNEYNLQFHRNGKFRLIDKNFGIHHIWNKHYRRRSQDRRIMSTTPIQILERVGGFNIRFEIQD